MTNACNAVSIHFPFLTIGTYPSLVRPQGQLINRVKVPVGVCHNVVAISNCVIVKWGGEQLEAKGQSVG